MEISPKRLYSGVVNRLDMTKITCPNCSQLVEITELANHFRIEQN